MESIWEMLLSFMYSATFDSFSEKILHYKLFSLKKLFLPCNVCFNLQWFSFTGWRLWSEPGRGER